MQGIIRRVDANEYLIRLFVVDHIIELLDEHIGPEEATEVMNFYLGLISDDGKHQFSEFKPLLNEILSDQELPKMVEHRFKMYLDYLFPGPMPT